MKNIAEVRKRLYDAIDIQTQIVMIELRQKTQQAKLAIKRNAEFDARSNGQKKRYAR